MEKYSSISAYLVSLMQHRDLSAVVVVASASFHGRSDESLGAQFFCV